MHKYIEDFFKRYKFCHELKFFNKKADFVYIDDKDKVHAIELKIKDWKNALIQIDTNQLFANFCYLGIWHLYVENVSKQIFKKYGFGLISISRDKIEILLKPMESTIILDKYSKSIKKKIIEGYN